MTAIAPPDVLCPKCHFPLVSERDVIAWCELCEWNLDVFDEPYAMRWPWRSLAKAEYRLGYRMDARIAATTQTDSQRAGLGEWILRLVSLALMALAVSLVAAGVWLITIGFFNLGTTLAGLAAFGLAYSLRPRLGSANAALRNTYPVDRQAAPALFGLLDRVADTSGVPTPDRVGLSEQFNASITTVGIRSDRILVIGLPLWVALRPQERVALLGHEFGHFAGQHSLRGLLAQPALRTFSTLARAIKPPTENAFDLGISGSQALLLLIWKIVGGILSGLLWTIHIGLTILGSRQQRRQELYADRIAVTCAGGAAAASLMNALAIMHLFEPFIDGRPPAGTAIQVWREGMEFARQRATPRVERLRQLTKRTHASLFSSHPAPGRRYDLVSGMRNESAKVVLTESEADRIDQELAPYTESFRRRLAAEQGW